MSAADTSKLVDDKFSSTIAEKNHSLSNQMFIDLLIFDKCLFIC